MHSFEVHQFLSRINWPLFRPAAAFICSQSAVAVAIHFEVQFLRASSLNPYLSICAMEGLID